MIEKVNPEHPDKVADRIAGALVDKAYSMQDDPKIATEVMLGHGKCFIIIESSVRFRRNDIVDIVHRIAKPEGWLKIEIVQVQQDKHLAENQQGKVRCGDNGLFKGVPLTIEQRALSGIARTIYRIAPHDGKYILDGEKLIICQSQIDSGTLRELFPKALINPLGNWNGGYNVDTGCTNRKLGSDMADSLTGGGLHGKDLSKADVSVNIYAFLKAQQTGEVVQLSCAIGDEYIDGKPYSEIVDTAQAYIKGLGGFEKLAEWGLY